MEMPQLPSPGVLEIVTLLAGLVGWLFLVLVELAYRFLFLKDSALPYLNSVWPCLTIATLCVTGIWISFFKQRRSDHAKLSQEAQAHRPGKRPAYASEVNWDIKTRIFVGNGGARHTEPRVCVMPPLEC
jgi:hypothetical protein